MLPRAWEPNDLHLARFMENLPPRAKNRMTCL